MEEVSWVSSSTPDALWSSRAIGVLRPAAITCRGIVRAIAGGRVLDGLDLTVAVGARLLLVSEPEDGASLLLRILAGLARADAGTLQIAGSPSPDDAEGGWSRRVAYVGRETGLHGWMTPRVALDLSARLAGFARPERHRRVERAATDYGLTASLDRPLGGAGPGLAQRVALAGALLPNPEVVLLDEPLLALSPRDRVRLLTIPETQPTMVVVTQHPGGLKEILDQVALLRSGRTAVHAPLTELERHGLPLSVLGISALAGTRWAAPPGAAAAVR